MINCRLAHLEARCKERGYSLDDAMACVVADHGGGVITVDETHLAYPRKRAGLGDMVASALSAVGITKERVSKAIGKPCGCVKRQQALNRIGRKFGIG